MYEFRDARRRRVAILSTWQLEPADNGRKQRTRQMIKALAENYEIVLVSLLPEAEYKAGNLPLVPDVSHQYVLPLPAFSPWTIGSIARGLHPTPRSLVSTWSPQTAASIREIVADTGAEIVMGTDLRTIRYLSVFGPEVSTVLDEPDVSWVLEPSVDGAGHLEQLRTAIRRWKYEYVLVNTTPALDFAVVASIEEAEAYRTLSHSNAVTVIANGVGTIPDRPWQVPNSVDLLYTGSLNYEPNAEAVSYYVDHIRPLVEEHAADSRLVVTGSVPNVLPEAAAHSSVHLTGVLNSLDGAFRNSRLFVAPLLTGTGTRVKLLEAMAYGMPIVSTSKGAEGLGVVDGRHMLIADSAEEFASAIVRLLRDPDLCLQLGCNGRELVKMRYCWSAVGEKLRQLVDGLLQNNHEGAVV